jgi:hypothetical protein
VRRRWFVLRKRAQALDSRVIGKHRDLHKPAYAATYPARAPDGACVGVEACICSYQNVSTKSTRGVSGCGTCDGRGPEEDRGLHLLADAAGDQAGDAGL